jgi:prevent-host-death family protein
MYMTTVGVAELRQNLSKYLQLVGRGERLIVTDRNRPVAELGPPSSSGEALDRLIAEGRVSRPARRSLPEPLQLTGDPHALSRALDEIRSDVAAAIDLAPIDAFVSYDERQSAAARLAGLRTAAPAAS